MSGHDVTDAGLEGDRGLAESPAGVDHPAGGVVEEGEQEGDAAAALGVGQARSVHEVGLNTLQRGEELELQVLLAVRLPLAGRALQAGRRTSRDSAELEGVPVMRPSVCSVRSATAAVSSGWFSR